ncbi:MAG: VOC family protein [Sterolibacteriaceae bacterium]|nr:VOC family protein [Candidatus Methylophosphatis haderslevensis]
MAPEIEGFDHIHVFVSNRPAAERWYAEVLGLFRDEALVFWAQDGGPLTLRNAAGTVHLALFERPSEKCRSTIALRVGAQSFQDWREHLRRFPEIAVEVEDHAVSLSLYFSDIDGNPFEITTYEHAKARDGLR